MRIVDPPPAEVKTVVASLAAVPDLPAASFSFRISDHYPRWARFNTT